MSGKSLLKGTSGLKSRGKLLLSDHKSTVPMYSVTSDSILGNGDLTIKEHCYTVQTPPLTDLLARKTDILEHLDMI